MKVQVLFFAAMRDAAGSSAQDVELPEGATVAQAWERLAEKHEPLRGFGRSMLCAVNAVYADMGRTLRDGDRVAFFPPVSGG